MWGESGRMRGKGGRQAWAWGAALALSVFLSSAAAASEGSGSWDSWTVVKFLGRFHPVVVHFPVALVLTAALAEVLFLITRRRFFTDGARLMVGLGAAGAVASVLLGFAARIEFGNTEMVVRHMIFGLSMSVAAVLAAGARETAEWKAGGGGWLWAYRALLFLSAALVSVTGYLGGLLTHGRDAFNWP